MSISNINSIPYRCGGHIRLEAKGKGVHRRQGVAWDSREAMVCQRK